ncbi:MAG TPA: MlaD family protein [Acetobacteraceae bacterium]|jgi:ABC-type transporter Mla subunit MlaD|nr:MlaD family protein [Acetobacteraceae bacterium]
MRGGGLYLRVGLLIVGGIALLFGLIWFLGGGEISHGSLYESYFSESVQGLEVGATVKYRGVTIGRVTAVGLVSAEYGEDASLDRERNIYRLVFVRYVVDTKRIGRMPDTQTAVALGLRARLASQGITGLSYLELDFVDPSRYPALNVPWTPKAEYIPSMPSTFSQVQDAAQQVLARLNRVDFDALVAQLTGVLTDLRSELTTGDVHNTLAEAATLLRSTTETVRAADLPGLTADLKRTSGSLRDTLQGEQMQKLIANASLAAERLASAEIRLPALIASLQATAQRAGNGTADLQQGLIPLLRDMQATAQNLREVTDSLRRYPAQVFAQPPPRTTEPAR